MKPDRETIKMQEKIKPSHDWVGSEGYARFKKIMMMKIVEQTSLLHLNSQQVGVSPASLAVDYRARELLGSMFLDALRDIEGEAFQYKANQDALVATEEDSMMLRIPERSEEL